MPDSDAEAAARRAPSRILDSLLGLQPTADGVALAPPGEWRNQWGAIFGGYVAAAAFRALELHAPEGQEPTAVHVDFLTRMRDAPASIGLDRGRTGDSASHATATMRQDGAPVSIATGWYTEPRPSHPGRFEMAAPPAGDPEGYEPVRPESEERLAFVGREFDIRPIPRAATEGPFRVDQWIRLRALEAGGALPAAAVAMVADMVGRGQYDLARLHFGRRRLLLSLDLTIHLVDVAQGPWLLLSSEGIALEQGRAVGRGAVFDSRRRYVGSIGQQSLIREFR